MGKFGTSIIRFSFLVQYYYTLGSFTGQFPVISLTSIHENDCNKHVCKIFFYKIFATLILHLQIKLIENYKVPCCTG